LPRIAILSSLRTAQENNKIRLFNLIKMVYTLILSMVYKLTRNKKADENNKENKETQTK